MALGHLSAAGFDVSSDSVLDLVAAKEQEARVLLRMMERGVNSPLTSSCGRLFDELEGLAIDEADEPGYEMELAGGDRATREPVRIGAGPLWLELLKDLRAGISKERIAGRFHAGVAAGFVRAAVLARAATGVRQVALSGGCMHNRRLARLLRAGLEAEGFEVFQHAQVSPGDGGLSYGQAVVGAAMLTNDS